MAYAYQTFSSGQIFTASQAQQIEDNIRDHRHGLNGVAAAGAAWTTVSKGATFSIASTDAGTLFKCWGDFNIDFATAATLGANFGAAFVNAGSGRVALVANSNQWINGNSLYSLTPGEGVIVTSDGTELDVLGGLNRARLFYYEQTATSLATIPVTRLYPGEFHHYVMNIQPILTTPGDGSNTGFRISTNSGSSYQTANYSNSASGDTTACWFFNTAWGSLQVLFITAQFPNKQSFGQQFYVDAFHLVTGGRGETYSLNTAVTTPINALQLYRNSGAFLAKTRVEIWGEGRIRR